MTQTAPARRLGTVFEDIGDDYWTASVGHAPTQPQPTPYEILRSRSTIDRMRESGTFFTASGLADLLWADALESISQKSVIVDPACGAADLLLPAARRVGGLDQLAGRVTFKGGDIDATFVRVARTRVESLTPLPMASRFVVRDFLRDQTLTADATHVVLNPPFVAVPAPSDARWAKGSVNSAALFVLAALDSMPAGSRLLALLPDVLRSGSRYSRWRSQVSSRGTLVRLETLGQFDSATDVHVFVLDMVREPLRQHEEFSWRLDASDDTRVEDLFHVRVGPVVPHRHAEVGDEVEYLTARGLSSGIGQRRRFSGRLESGPFVVINRTSRPGEIPRARARIWTGSAPVAVENHLVVLSPRDGSLSACKELIRVLEDSRTATFLNERIRCRHLTVGSVKEIPWLPPTT